MPINDGLIEIISNEGHNIELTPYLMFKYAIKTDITRRYYERRLKKFFDFIEYEITDKNIEYRCNKFGWFLEVTSHYCRFVCITLMSFILF